MMTDAVQNLLLANGVIWILSIFIFSPDLIFPYFALIPVKVIQDLYVWQIFTYMFLHSPDPVHIIFNMFALWFFGTELERNWGTAEFYRYYFLTGIAAGVCILVWNLFTSPAVLTIGASGAVFGILIAYAVFFPERVIYIWGMLPVKAKYLGIGYGFLELMMLPSQDGISHIGHLGGMIFGFFYIKQRYKHWGIGRDFFKNFFKSNRY